MGRMTITMQPGEDGTLGLSLADKDTIASFVKGHIKMKHDPDFARAAAPAYAVTADELRQFIERFERLQTEKQDIADQQKDVMSEAKGRGYDTKVMRKIIALRRRKPDEVAEEQAVLDLYLEALGMT